MDLQFAFDRPVGDRFSDLSPPIVPRENPRFSQSFFDWYEPEEKPPVNEAPSIDAPASDRSAAGKGEWKQLRFSWYAD